MEPVESNVPVSELSRSDFLKNAGLAGLGLFGLNTMMSAPVSAEEGKNTQYCVVISHGTDDPNRAILALVLAEVALKKGLGKVHVWMTLGGADLCQKGHPEKISSAIFNSFGTAFEVMERIKNGGGTFGVCPPCADYFGAKAEAKYDWIALQGGDWLLTNLQKAHTVWL